MAESTSIDQFRSSLLNHQARQRIGFATMTDADAEWIAGDQVLLQAYYDRWLSTPAPHPSISLMNDESGLSDEADLSSRYPMPPPITPPLRVSGAARGALIALAIVGALVLVGLLVRGLSTSPGYPDGCNSVPDSQGTSVDC